MVAFVAVENAAGLVGFKQTKSVLVSTAHLQPQQFATTTPAGLLKELVGNKHLDTYESRIKMLAKSHFKDEEEKSSILNDVLKDAIGNRATVVELLTLKSNPQIRVLMCSSVNSMTKYIANHCAANAADTIDTLIIFGHGSADAMNVGLGRIGGYNSADLAKAKKQDDKTGVRDILEVRTRLGLEDAGEKKGRIRNIEVDNKDRWLASFGEIQPYIVAHPASHHFHIYFMACKAVGKSFGKPIDRSLLKTAANALTKLFGVNVIAAAPEGEIDKEDLIKLVENLDEANEVLSDGRTYKVISTSIKGTD
jgi:hypothetical protein